MKEQIKQIEDFYKKFKQPCTPTVNLLEYNRAMLRYNLMKEENKEYLDAIDKGDVVEIADALGDMMYILCGTIIEHGLQDKIVDIFNEIHRSNMSKLGEDGEPILREDGKILKGRGYFKPDISSILNQSRYDKSKFTPPFRVGRKQGKAVLDSKGLEVVFFEHSETQAKLYCDYLNNEENTENKIAAEKDPEFCFCGKNGAGFPCDQSCNVEKGEN